MKNTCCSYHYPKSYPGVTHYNRPEDCPRVIELKKKNQVMKSKEQIMAMLEGTKEAKEKAANSLLVGDRPPPIGEIATTVAIINKYDNQIEILEWVLGEVE